MMLGYMKREPVYPLWLAGIRRLTGRLDSAVLCLFQTPLAMLAAYIIYRLGSRLFGDSTARLASITYALHPISFWYSTRFASETMAVPTLLLCIFACERFLADPTATKAVHAGGAIGLAALTKSASIVVLPIVLLFALFSLRRELKRVVSYAAIVVTVCGGIQSIWLVRNYSVSGAIVPFTTTSGVVFFIGNEIVERFDVKKQTAGHDPDAVADALYRSVEDQIERNRPSMPLPQLEAETDRQLRKMASDLIFRDPLFIVHKVAAGLYFIWFLSDTSAKSIGWLMFQLPLVALAIVGVLQKSSWSDSKKMFLVSVTIAYIVPYLLLSPLARYSLPVFPIVMLFASSGMIGLRSWLRRADGILRPASI
jgi:4-amino-4-deoxy-L-arabinose transferase-like glycosyltransferase